MKFYQMFFHMLKKKEITPLRMYNLFLSHLCYIFHIKKTKGHPSILMMEPTNFCNLKCPVCPTGNGGLKAPRGFMGLENFKKIIDETGKYLLNLTLWNYGEPFLNKELYKMIKYAREKNVFVRISTNGHVFQEEENIKKLIDSDVDYLIISLDGASKETFSKYRKEGDFDTVINNIHKIIKEKKANNGKGPFIEIQFIIMKHNEHEVPKMKEIAKSLDVDKIKMKTVNIEMGLLKDLQKVIKEYLPKTKKYSRYSQSGAKLQRKGMEKNCKRLWLSSVINWDGSVVPCCYDPNRKYELGNAFENNLKEVWNNEKYIALRNTLIKNKTSIEMCKNCTGNLTGLDADT